VLFKQLPPDTFLKSFSMLLSSIITLPDRERERERESFILMLRAQSIRFPKMKLQLTNMSGGDI
jgi:hypothetical protein